MSDAGVVLVEMGKVAWPQFLARPIDTVHVTRLAEAKVAGATIPPILVDRATMEIIDGCHRYRMHERLGIKKIAVTFLDGGGDKDRFLLRLKSAADSRLPLSDSDRIAAVNVAKSLGISNREVAKHLAVEVDRLMQIIERKGATSPDGKEIVYVKSDLRRHLAGKRLTTVEAEVNRSSTASGGLHLLRQLIGHIRVGAMDFENEEIAKAVAELLALLKDGRRGAA